MPTAYYSTVTLSPMRIHSFRLPPCAVAFYNIYNYSNIIFMPAKLQCTWYCSSRFAYNGIPPETVATLAPLGSIHNVAILVACCKGHRVHSGKLPPEVIFIIQHKRITDTTGTFSSSRPNVIWAELTEQRTSSHRYSRQRYICTVGTVLWSLQVV